MSEINAIPIDETYPLAGVNNNTQGFRDNFAAIKNGLLTAATEITALESDVSEIQSVIGTVQQQDLSEVLSAVSGVNTITGISSKVFASYTSGLRFQFRPIGLNTSSAVTLDVNSRGPRSVKLSDGTLLPPSSLAPTSWITVQYNGADFIVVGAVAAQNFTQNGANAITRTIQNKLQDTYSFQDFGAIGDGVIDDTAALQNAINAVAALPRGGILLGRPGCTYKVTSTIILASRVKIDLCQAAIVQHTNNIPIVSAPANIWCPNWGLRNGELIFNTQQDGLATVQVNVSGTILVGDEIVGLSTGTKAIVRSISGSTMQYIGNGLFASGENLLILGSIQGTTTGVATPLRQGVGLRLANGSFSWDFVVENLNIIKAYDGIMCPPTTGSFAFVGQIQNYTGADCARWSIALDCDGAVGGNTNIVLTNCWAIPSTPLYNTIVVNVSGTIANGNIIVGEESGARGRVKSVSGSGALKTVVFDTISWINFFRNEKIVVSGIEQGVVTEPNTQPFSSGFYFNACSQFQWQSLFADKIRGQFLFAQTSTGWFGVLSHEASLVESMPNFEASGIVFSNVNASVSAIKFIGNEFKTYNQITVGSVGTLAIGDNIAATDGGGVATGATGTITHIYGTGSTRIIRFVQNSSTNFAVGNQVRVNGVQQGVVGNATLNNGNVFLVRHTADGLNTEFVINNDYFGCTAECIYTGRNIYEVSCTAPTVGPPPTGAAWYYNLRGESARVGGVQLADFGSTKMIRSWNGENRYYTLGMTADAAWDGKKDNLIAAPMNAANSYTGYTGVATDRQLRFKCTAYGNDRDGGITLLSSDGINDQYITKALRLRTNNGGVPRLSIVGPDNGNAGWEILTSNAGTETRRLAGTSTGSILVGAPAQLATDATSGFLYVPTCNGVPTGVPEAQTGLAPIVINTASNKLYFYSGGQWRDAGP